MNNVIAAVVLLGIMGLIFGLILAVASKVFAVETDPRLEPLTECLPGANCGGCGYAGCGAYANAVIAGTAPIGACPVGGAACAAKMGAVMGVEVSAAEPNVAVVRCSGGGSDKLRYQYVGVQDCLAATRIPGGGPMTCAFGCMGLGTCERACPFDAIHVVDGLAQVDESKCTGCGACVKVCPHSVIELTPASAPVLVKCSSKAAGKTVTKACSDGCIGCRLCAKNCPETAITIDSFLAYVDYSKCSACGTCVTKCPRKIIHAVDGKIKIEAPAPEAKPAAAVEAAPAAKE